VQTAESNHASRTRCGSVDAATPASCSARDRNGDIAHTDDDLDFAAKRLRAA
jgi:hypothetical protein